MTIPRIARTNGVSAGIRTCTWVSLGRTVENRADEKSGEIGLLLKVQRVRELWSIRTIGPIWLRVGHNSDVYEEGFRRRAGSILGDGREEKDLRARWKKGG